MKRQRLFKKSGQMAVPESRRGERASIGESSDEPRTHKTKAIIRDEAGEDEGPVETRGTSRGEGLGNPLAASTPQSQAEWLQSLDIVQAQAVYELMCAEKKVSEKLQCSEEDAQDLVFLQASQGSDRDGRWWASWATCEVVDTTAKKKDHPRWDPRLNGGPQSAGQKLARVVGPKKFGELLALTNWAKFQTHHVAYNSDPRREAEPLPLNAGSGGSVSHLCDERGCIKLCHLESTPVHKANMDRQRCGGVVLVHMNGFILAEQPCVHGVKLADGGSLADRIRLSCRHLRLCEIAQGAVEWVLQ